LAESKSDSTRGREDSKQFGCPESFIEKTRIQSAVCRWELTAPKILNESYKK